jgi:hypothetical protein
VAARSEGGFTYLTKQMGPHGKDGRSAVRLSQGQTFEEGRGRTGWRTQGTGFGHKHPGGHNTLDDLCSRYGVDRSHRTKHTTPIANPSAERIGEPDMPPRFWNRFRFPPPTVRGSLMVTRRVCSDFERSYLESRSTSSSAAVGPLNLPYRFFGFDSAISEVVNYAKKVDTWRSDRRRCRGCRRS